MPFFDRLQVIVYTRASAGHACVMSASCACHCRSPAAIRCSGRIWIDPFL